MNLSFLQFIWKNNCGNGVPTIEKLWERRSHWNRTLRTIQNNYDDEYLYRKHQGCARGLTERGETEASGDETEASVNRSEARPRPLSSLPRRERDEALARPRLDRGVCRVEST